MKYVFLLLLLCMNSYEVEPTSGEFKFIKYKKFLLQETLPPKILLEFDVPCNYDFIKIVRVEKIEEASKLTNIALGGIFKENLLSACAGKNKKIIEGAGDAFSGKEYKIVQIH